MDAEALADRLESSARNRDDMPNPTGRRHEDGGEAEEKVWVEFPGHVEVLCYVGYYDDSRNWDVYWRGQLAGQSHKELWSALQGVRQALRA